MTQEQQPVAAVTPLYTNPPCVFLFNLSPTPSVFGRLKISNALHNVTEKKCRFW